jgi:hypothetical protein
MNEVEATLTIEDLVAFYRHHATQAKPIRVPASGCIWLLLALLAFVLLTVYTKAWHDAQFLFLGMIALFIIVPFVLLVLLATLFPTAFTARSLRRRAARGDLDKALRPQLFQIGPKCLVVSAADAQSMLLWQAIHRIDTTADHAFIYIDPNIAHVLPKRCFPSDEAFDKFVEQMRQYHRAATPA